MQLQQFISSLQSSQSIQTYPVIYFIGQEYPALFFSQLFDYVRQQKPVQRIDPTMVPMQEVIASLEMSFLGNEHIAWLGNVGELEPKMQKQVFVYSGTYVGPHKLWFFVPTDLSRNLPDTGCIVTLPSTVTLEDYTHICHLFMPSLSDKTKAFKKVFEQHAVSLDIACLLMVYHRVLGRNITSFLDDWLLHIIKPGSSLFTLSTQFFAKDAAAFYHTWHTISQEYPSTFWIVFWSEQLFRAHSVVQCMQQKKPTQAKAVSYRLPFSFMQQDWKRFSLAELQNAHRYVYSLDYAVKNGGNEGYVDLFYGLFFTGQFI